jgi:hypothetical protein
MSFLYRQALTDLTITNLHNPSMWPTATYNELKKKSMSHPLKQFDDFYFTQPHGHPQRSLIVFVGLVDVYTFHP